MSLSRRQLLKLIAAGKATGVIVKSRLLQAAVKPENKAIAFDGFPIFDPRPIFALTKKLFPEQGDMLNKLWFAIIFAYTCLRTSGDHYKGFHAVK